MNISAGIDLGGTKILTTLFDGDWAPMVSQRVDTPSNSYEALLTELGEQIQWVTEQHPVGAIGMGVPGILDRQSLVLRAANLSANNRQLGVDLAARTELPVYMINDSKAFALSEAVLGAGTGFHSVLGISIGTGTAAGLVVNKQVLSFAAGMAGEIGHLKIPATTANRLTLPIVKCDCGQSGCYETFLSGPGLVRLGTQICGTTQPVEQWIARYQSSDRQAHQLLDHWFGLLAALIAEMMLCYDPDCIVVGGGMIALPDFIDNTLRALDNTPTLSPHTPVLKLADGLEHSAARGAALHSINPDFHPHTQTGNRA